VPDTSQPTSHCSARDTGLQSREDWRATLQARVGILRNPARSPLPPPRPRDMMRKWPRMRSSRRPSGKESCRNEALMDDAATDQAVLATFAMTLRAAPRQLAPNEHPEPTVLSAPELKSILENVRQTVFREHPSEATIPEKPIDAPPTDLQKHAPFDACVGNNLDLPPLRRTAKPPTLFSLPLWILVSLAVLAICATVSMASLRFLKWVISAV
jgi:hypothetical protein